MVSVVIPTYREAETIGPLLVMLSAVRLLWLYLLQLAHLHGYRVRHRLSRVIMTSTRHGAPHG